MMNQILRTNITAAELKTLPVEVRSSVSASLHIEKKQHWLYKFVVDVVGRSVVHGIRAIIFYIPDAFKEKCGSLTQR